MRRRSRFCGCTSTRCRCTSVRSRTEIGPSGTWRPCIPPRRGPSGSPNSHHIFSLLARTNRSKDHISMALYSLRRSAHHPADSSCMLGRDRKLRSDKNGTSSKQLNSVGENMCCSLIRRCFFAPRTSKLSSEQIGNYIQCAAFAACTMNSDCPKLYFNYTRV